jgi:hypothetical protein
MTNNYKYTIAKFQNTKGIGTILNISPQKRQINISKKGTKTSDEFKSLTMMISMRIESRNPCDYQNLGMLKSLIKMG